MSRPIPSAFIGKDTYGVVTDKNRDRLPVINQSDKGTLPEIISGPRDIAIRLCIAALPAAETTEEVGRLVIGALLDASGVTTTTARVHSSFAGDIAESIKSWATPLAFPTETDELPEDNHGTESAARAELPMAVLPSWLQYIDFRPEDLVTAWRASSGEVAAYAGILALCIGKQPTAENLEAFNQRRRPAVEQHITSGDLFLFVEDSKFLSLEVLGKVHRAFNTIIVDRYLTMNAIVDADTALVSGKKRIFYILFRLSAGTSLNSLLIITRFARKYPSFYSEFRDLETEYHAAAHALQRFYDVPEKRRMYLKVIYGSAYVPIDRNDVAGLLGVAVFALQQTEPSLANYAGGSLSVSHREKLLRLLDMPEQVQEEIPEDEE